MITYIVVIIEPYDANNVHQTFDACDFEHAFEYAKQVAEQIGGTILLLAETSYMAKF